MLVLARRHGAGLGLRGGGRASAVAGGLGDAEAHAGEDAKRKELVEAKNLAEQMVYAAEKAVKDAGEKAPAEVVSEVNEKIADLKTKKDGDDLAAITAASEALSASLSKIGESMMKDQPAPGAEAPAEGAAPEPGATDAEFTEKPPEA